MEDGTFNKGVNLFMCTCMFQLRILNLDSNVSNTSHNVGYDALRKALGWDSVLFW